MKFNRIAGALMAFAMLVAASATMSAQQMPELPKDKAVRYGVLENGLTYYIRHNEEPKDRVNFYIAQKVGSVNENDSQRGLAHFLEHMCFNGSVNFPADGSLIKYCEGIGVKFGANLNAYTSTDETVYNIDDIPVTENNLDSCLLILHDWADGLLLETSEIDKERGVIHEEWRMRSSAQQRILERALPKLYPGSKYAYRMPIGIMEVVDNFAPEVLRAYYEAWYRPDLQGIVIVGDVDVDAMEARIKKVFGPIKMPADPQPFEYFPVPSNEEPIYVVESDKEQQQPTILICLKQDAMPREMMNTMMYYIQNYMTSVICSSVNARLQELSMKPECPYIAAGIDYGQFLISKTMDCLEVYVLPKPGMDAEAVQVVMTELERARRFGIMGSEINRSKDEFLSAQDKLYDNRDKQKNSYYVNKYVRNFLDNSAIPGLETEHQMYQMIAEQLPVQAFNQTLAQMAESITKDFVFLAMYPEKEGVAVPSAEQFKAAVEASRAAELEAYVDNAKDEPLVPVLPKAVKIKKQEAAAFGYTKLALSNGANVFYKKTDFNDSEILFRANSLGGYSVLPEKDLVNAKMVSAVINAQGIGNFNSIELEKALAGKQVSFNIGLGQLQESLSGNSTPKDLETLFQLIYLSFQEPADDEASFNNTMSRQRSQLENAEKDPLSSFRDSISVTLYGSNPYIKGLKFKDLDQVSYSEIKRIYKNRFQSAGDFNFYFTGNFDEETLKQLVSQYIAPLPKQKKRETFVDRTFYPREGVNENCYTRQMETPQAYLVQVWSGADEFTNKESVIVDALGNVLDQRYLKSIREDGGMAYSVNTQAQTNYGYREEYLIQTVCPFTPALVEDVLRLLREDIDKIAAEGVTEAELAQYREYELKNWADSQRRNGFWANQISGLVSWGKDTYTGYEDVVKSVTSDDIRNFVNEKLLKQNNCSTIIMLPKDLTE